MFRASIDRRRSSKLLVSSTKLQHEVHRGGRSARCARRRCSGETSGNGVVGTVFGGGGIAGSRSGEGQTRIAGGCGLHRSRGLQRVHRSGCLRVRLQLPLRGLLRLPLLRCRLHRALLRHLETRDR